MGIIQFGVFDEVDDYALVELGKKWLKVPCWLACQWDTGNGGIYGIVRDYGLEQMTIFRPWEYKAMDNMRNEARAMRRFYLYGDTGVLTDIERRCLNIEADTRTHHPHLRGDAMYEHMAMVMGTDYTPRQVRAILQDATEVLRMNEDGIEEEYYAKLGKRIAKLNARLAEIDAVGIAA
jgi:hypothetical protein